MCWKEENFFLVILHASSRRSSEPSQIEVIISWRTAEHTCPEQRLFILSTLFTLVHFISSCTIILLFFPCFNTGHIRAVSIRQHTVLLVKLKNILTCCKEIMFFSDNYVITQVKLCKSQVWLSFWCGFAQVWCE